MSRIGYFCALVILVRLSGCSNEPSYRLADGDSISFSELRGDWVVINYWAEWCAPCRKEIPELNELPAIAAEQGAVFRVLGVNYDGLQDADLIAVIERMQIEFPVLADDPRIQLGVPRAEVLPMTVVINPQGEVQSVMSGPQTAQSILASRNP